VPALLLKIGRYPLHSGGVAVVRTLGRLGVPVYAVTEDRWTPTAVSRYCAGRFVWRVTGREEPEHLVALLRSVAERIGHRTVVVPADDEAAVLVAEHAESLAPWFFLPAVPAGLPRELASKQRLFELCRRHDVPTPATAFPASAAEVAAFAQTATFPVVVKDAEPWVRRRAPVAGHTTVVRDARGLLAMIPASGRPGVILQEYIPREHAQDWFTHLYCDANSDCLCMFTGVKVRSWPPHSGASAASYHLANPELAQLTAGFCKKVGFRGIGDLDWRLDLRDGNYKLVDFNPRMGNQFRLFETAQGVDVVRALHLDLTGRPVPPGAVPDGRWLFVEHIDGFARLAYRGTSGYPAAPPPVARARGRGGRELAWLAADDPLPFLAMLPRLAGGSRSSRRHAKSGAR
jgi:predicted ATP-grasp superfamily ATP-dependent carboligase